MKKLLIASLTLAGIGFATRLPAQLERSCRAEIVRLCGMTRDRDAIRSCLRQKYQSLSKPCVKNLMDTRRERETGAVGAMQYQYGAAEKQMLDYYPAPKGGRPALIVFIHGGGWSIGDKRSGTKNKASHYNGLGYAFASLNYRLVPETDPAGQATDVAKALAYLRARADSLGFDPDRIILSGHSAGAHLAALVSTDPRYLSAAGIPMASIRGTVLLDGAGYDVPRQMAKTGPIMGKMYRAAFTTDLATQLRLSPMTYAGAPNVLRWLILFDDSRADSRAQSETLAAALNRAGEAARAIAVSNTSHMKLNRDLGVEGDAATALVDAFIRRAL